MIIQQLFQKYPIIKNNFHKIIDHYQQMTLLQKAGGLRKDLNPKICVIIHLDFNYQINPFDAAFIAEHVAYQYQQINTIPWQYKPFIIPSS